MEYTKENTSGVLLWDPDSLPLGLTGIEDRRTMEIYREVHLFNTHAISWEHTYPFYILMLHACLCEPRCRSNSAHQFMYEPMDKRQVPLYFPHHRRIIFKLN